MITEYGARIIQTGLVYMHGPLKAVQEFIIEYEVATPLALVTRTRDGDMSSAWTLVPSINSSEERSVNVSTPQREVAAGHR